MRMIFCFVKIETECECKSYICLPEKIKFALTADTPTGIMIVCQSTRSIPMVRDPNKRKRCRVSPAGIFCVF